MTLKRLARKAVQFFGYDLIPLKNPAFDDQKELLGRDAEIIVDVGAAIGKTATIYRQLFPRARLYLLEPHPALYKVLTHNIRNDPLAFPFNLAASDSEAKRILTLNRSPYTSSLLPLAILKKQWLTHGEADPKGTVEVSATTLDQFCVQQSIQHIDVLKVDVQGGELLVFGGAAGLLSSGRISIIYAEVSLVEIYAGQPLLHDVLVFLDRFGYRLHNLYDLAVKMKTGRLMWGDALFVKAVEK